MVCGVAYTNRVLKIRWLELNDRTLYSWTRRTSIKKHYQTKKWKKKHTKFILCVMDDMNVRKSLNHYDFWTMCLFRNLFTQLFITTTILFFALGLLSSSSSLFCFSIPFEIQKLNRGIENCYALQIIRIHFSRSAVIKRSDVLSDSFVSYFLSSAFVSVTMAIKKIA